jgi:hypothetical protein
MSALRSSMDLQSIRTLHIVVQNEDGTFPPAYSLIATDEKGRGNTMLVQDISVNSVTLFGDASAGVLSFSDVSGLLVNSAPISELHPLVPFDSVAPAVSLPDLALSYNYLLQALNGKIITVNPLPFVTHITVTINSQTSVTLSWTSVGAGYNYNVYLDTILQTTTTENNYTLTGLSIYQIYLAEVEASNTVFSGSRVQRFFLIRRQGIIQQTVYSTGGSPPYLFVPFGSYFDSGAFGNIIIPIATINISANGAQIVPVGSFGDNRIFLSDFYLSPPIDLLNMVLWVDCDDGCAIRITDPDTNIVTDLINTESAWSGGSGVGFFKYPADASGNGIFLNLFEGKYYKIECNSTNNIGLTSCRFLYTIPIPSSPPTPVTYIVDTGDANAMLLMSGATPTTLIPPHMGTLPPGVGPTSIPIPASWYYI